MFKSGVHETFIAQNKGIISDSILQGWTLQATECYCLSGNCTLCSIKSGNYSFICQMKKVVQKLLEKFGEPDASQLATFQETYEQTSQYLQVS